MSEIYGPALPPGFQRNPDNDNIVTSSDGYISYEDNLPTCSESTSNSREADSIDSERTAHHSHKDTEVSSSWQQRLPSDCRSSCQETSVSSLSEKEDSIMIAPIVPSSQKSKPSSSNVEVSSSTSLKEHKIIGPQLPNMNTVEMKASASSSSDTVNSESCPGPNQSKNLSPDKNASSFDMFGPALPPDLIKAKAKDDCSESEKPSTVEEDYSLIGPLPSEMFKQGMKDKSVADDIEKRSSNMKDKLANKGNEALTRETWMLELPPEIGPGLGLVARTFKQSKGTSEPKDRSVWTDTPVDQAKKKKDGDEKHAGKRSAREAEHFTSERDQQCLQIVDEHNKSSRSESLLNMHEKKRKIAKKDNDEPVLRQPFNRETDIEAVHLNSNQRKSIIDRSSSLSTRFGSGKSRFL